jgi:hypothetical protein
MIEFNFFVLKSYWSRKDNELGPEPRFGQRNALCPATNKEFD